MESEKLGGILGAIVAAVVLAIAFAYGPMGSFGKPAKQGQTEVRHNLSSPTSFQLSISYGQQTPELHTHGWRPEQF